MNTSVRTAAINLISEDLMKKQMNKQIVYHATVLELHVHSQEYLFIVKKDQSQKTNLIVLVVQVVLVTLATIRQFRPKQ